MLKKHALSPLPTQSLYCSPVTICTLEEMLKSSAKGKGEKKKPTTFKITQFY